MRKRDHQILLRIAGYIRQGFGWNLMYLPLANRYALKIKNDHAKNLEKIWRSEMLSPAILHTGAANRGGL